LYSTFPAKTSSFSGNSHKAAPFLYLNAIIVRRLNYDIIKSNQIAWAARYAAAANYANLSDQGCKSCKNCVSCFLASHYGALLVGITGKAFAIETHVRVAFCTEYPPYQFCDNSGMPSGLHIDC
jgi:hypothetical protein